jgi:hypothetical protein
VQGAYRQSRTPPASVVIPSRPVRPTQPAPVAPPRREAASHELRLHTPARPAPQIDRVRSGGGAVVALFLGVLAGLNLLGLDYYLAPRAEQVRDPLHAWFRPSGYVGQSAGLLALAIFLFLWLYPVRKRFRWLAFTGGIPKWLNVHVLAAIGLPLLVATHAAWRFDGVIGLGFWAMMVVWASGLVGRYLYARIPRSQAGVELSIGEIAAQRQTLLEEIARRSGLAVEAVEQMLAPDPSPTAGLGLWRTLGRLISDDRIRRRAARRLRRELRRRAPMRRTGDGAEFRQVLRLANREMALVQQSRMLGATRNILRFWHVAHRPLAVTALAAVLIHVVVVVVVGATWLW